MYYFALFDDKRLAGFSVCKKNSLIHQAIKNCRKDHPVNFQQQLIKLVMFSFLPAALLYALSGWGMTVAWLLASSNYLSYLLARKETPIIRPYLYRLLDRNQQDMSN